MPHVPGAALLVLGDNAYDDGTEEEYSLDWNGWRLVSLNTEED